MTEPTPDKHPTTAVGAAHRFNHVTQLFAAEPYSQNRVRITVSVEVANVLSDAVEMFNAATIGDDQ